MLLDIIHNEKAYFLKIHQNFFENKSVPLSVFQEESVLMERYKRLGFFQTTKESLGFNGCLKLQDETKDYRTYKFDISCEMRPFLMTVNLLTDYVLEQIYLNGEFKDDIWKDQSLSFTILNGERNRGGYGIGGKIFPWFKGELISLNNDSLINLNLYVKSELTRVCQQIYHKEFSYGHVTIKNDFFFVQVDIDGRWVTYTRKKTISLEEFSSHNIDHSVDQELCFAAVVAINTFLRNNKSTQ